ncbi:hypothetical protein [Halomonas sp. THAF5a]|uniref:hypothetical protein n=1 Tax=Halomonas sp. THAF5a TaxID=2587844 RepID=UPI001268B6FD|nr:hypothetical protein [Halomonas sp. THAF5a]
MIRRILSAGPVWLLAVLLGITVYAGMQARHYAEALGASQARVARVEDRAAILLEHQRWQNRQIATMTEALGERDERLLRDGELLDLVRQAARNLERDDAKTADWAGQPSPAAVRQWLRDLRTGAGHGAGGDGAGGAELPGSPAAGPDAAGDAQP